MGLIFCCLELLFLSSHLVGNRDCLVFFVLHGLDILEEGGLVLLVVGGRVREESVQERG